MITWIMSKLRLAPDSVSDQLYLECVAPLFENEAVICLKNYTQHRNMDRLEHSLYVSYISYLVCRRLGLDYRSAARGGLLHDFYLYDRHVDNPYKGRHGYMHPRIALQTATAQFELNDREKDIIARHMWPLTIKPPKYKESYIVTAADKYCAFMETMRFGKKANLYRAQNIIAAGLAG